MDFYAFNLNLLKMRHKSAEGRIKAVLCFLFKFSKKRAPNRPKANYREFYVFIQICEK
jgi:hypothetical protein